MNYLVLFLIVLLIFGFISILTGIVIYIVVYLKEVKRIKEDSKFGPR